MAKWFYDSRPRHYFLDIHQTVVGRGINRRLGLKDVRGIAWIAFEVEWKSQARRLVWINVIILYAVRAGALDLLEAVYDIHNMIVNSQTTSEGSDKDVHFSQIAVNLMDEAVRCGHLAIVQWLFNCQSLSCTTKAMDRAATQGRLDIVKWLHHNQSQGCTSKAMDNAANRGHLDIVRWLHNTRHEGCSTQAMDSAAINGHLEVVQWLHENRSEGCTTAAMDFAARNGHLHVVQWLHENRTEGCTTMAMDGASWNGHIDVLQYLHVHYNEGFTKYTMAGAAIAGQLEAFKWLHENRTDGCSEQALETSNCEVLEFTALFTTYFSLERIVEALEKHGHFGTIDSVFRKTHSKRAIPT